MPTILDLAREIDPRLEEKDIQPLTDGYSSSAYKISGTVPMVLLRAKAGSVSTPHYGHAFVVLTLLARRGYVHAPTPLWLKDDQSAIAVSFHTGIPADEFARLKNTIDTEAFSLRVIDALFDVAEILPEEYLQECVRNHVTPLPPETPEDAARLYGTDWFAHVERSCPDKDIIAWLRPRIEQAVAYAASIRTATPVFSHGDPSNPNILIDDSSFVFIDWDSARFQAPWSEYLVAYTTNLIDFMKPHRENIITHIAKRLQRDRDEFDASVLAYRRFAEVFDVNWAALMMAKAANSEITGSLGKYRAIAHERIAKYDAAFPRTD